MVTQEKMDLFGTFYAFLFELFYIEIVRLKKVLDVFLR